MRIKAIVAALVAVLTCTVFVATPAQAQWDKEIGFYLWALGLDGDMTIRGQTASTDVSFGDIFDVLEFAFSLHVEAEHPSDKWGIFFDAYVAQLGDDLATPPGEFDIDMSFLELAAAYRTAQEFQLFFGLRSVTIDGLLRIRPPTPGPGQPTLQVGDEQSFVDPMIGGRLVTPIGQKWTFRGRFDAAGFGVSDGSDLTLNLQLLGQYQATNKLSLLFGYRVMDMDYEDTDAGFGMDVTMSGPVLAASFSF